MLNKVTTFVKFYEQKQTNDRIRYDMRSDARGA